MRNTIARFLGWALSPALLWALTLLFPATGRRRRGRAPKRRAASVRALRTGGSAACPAVEAEPARQAPQTCGETSDVAHVRPYWTAHERSVRRRGRRVLWMATVGLDLDTRNIHLRAHGVRARPVLGPGWTVTGGGL
ncbi:hypothetical protein SAMN05192584_101168 [Streptomyces pini]|uniref:Uncharacterized protein n=1 Tax=Streptomyces pini TaxID=1520580 RepID=A0A1I3U1V8_9ACTN|nr:hypothetical protein SAMN05192584_101168 [Streptomyces pini]